MGDRVVVVTGASSGVGRATARAFADAGADIALLARGRDALENTAKEIESSGRRAAVFPTDVADHDQVEASASEIERTLGPIDVWVNDAMVSVFSPFLEMSPDEFRRVTEVTYLGAVNGTYAALRRMVPRDRGVIVQVGSALAYRGIPLQSAYCGAKHAVQGFTESVRCELIHERSRVRITMVHLPALNTPHFDVALVRLPWKPQPVPPIYQPEIAARAVVLASDHPRRELWVGGSTAATLIANSIVPGLLDRYLGRTGYRTQQSAEPIPPGRPSNLWDPVPGDRGAHGRFDARSHPHSIQFWLASQAALAAEKARAALATSFRITRAVAEFHPRRNLEA
jgi:NAD(P)-dependent dehydrogenase (short-subunit alcohol dehydrogenase family)